MSGTNRLQRIRLVMTQPWFIAAAAFFSRVAFLWYQVNIIPHDVLARVPFDQEAGNIAYALAQGHGFSNLFRQATGATAWLAPIYPFMLSGVFRLFGSFTFTSFFVAALMNCAFSAAVTFPLYDLGRRIRGREVASAAGWIWVALPAGILMPTEWIWDTSLSVLLATTVVWATIVLSETKPGIPRRNLWCGYALLWGLVLLTNPSLGIVLPFLILWAAARSGDLSAGSWKFPLAALAIIFLCSLPWTVRNFRQFGKLVPLRSNFSFELWIGNNDIFDEHATGGIQRITRFEETRKYAQLGENAYLAEKWNAASAFIRQKPELFWQLTWRRVLATWIGTEHPYKDFRDTDSQLAKLVIATNLLLTLGTILGMLNLARARNPFAYPIALMPALYPLVYYITHTSLRYRHPMDPQLILLTCAAMAGWPRSKSSHR